MVSVLFYTALCWGCSFTVDDKNWINKLIRKAGLVFLYVLIVFFLMFNCLFVLFVMCNGAK